MLAATLAIALTLAAPAATSASLPKQGVLVPGESLGGIRLGDTPAAVERRWGKSHRPCSVCGRRTWLYTYADATVGAAVSFRNGRVTAVFTLGSPVGWHTRDGLSVGAPAGTLLSRYPGSRWTRCVGYHAASLRAPRSVTSIFTSGDLVYGFGLARPTEPVCA